MSSLADSWLEDDEVPEAAIEKPLASAPAVSALPAARHERVPALDGIRGLAILLVLFYHFAGIGLHNQTNIALVVSSQYGWVGVDLFFVLSGFLITGILIDAKGSEGYFKSFYARRIVRIFPAYYALLAIVFIIAPYLASWGGTPDNHTVYGPHWTYWLYFYNIYCAFKAHSQGLVGHSWTLAIEEQFYLVWPAIVFYCHRKQLLRVCLILAATALALRIILLSAGASVYVVGFLTVTRMDSLTIGAAIALLLREPDGATKVRSLARKLIWIAPTIMVLIYAGKKIHSGLFTFCDESSKYTLIALFFAALISLSVTAPPTARLNRAFSNSIMRFFGRYSYGIYLFHVPMLMLISEKLPRPLSATQQLLAYMLFFVSSVLVGLLSWNLVEKHFLKLKRYFPSEPRMVRRLPDSPAAGAAISA